VQTITLTDHRLSFTGFHNEEPLFQRKVPNNYWSDDPKISVPVMHDGNLVGTLVIPFAIIDGSRSKSVGEGAGSDFERLRTALGSATMPPSTDIGNLQNDQYCGAGFTVEFKPSNADYVDVGWVQLYRGNTITDAPNFKYKDAVTFDYHFHSQKTTADMPGGKSGAPGADFRLFLYKTSSPCMPIAVIEWSYNVSAFPLGLGKNPTATLYIFRVTSPVPTNALPQEYKTRVGCP